MVPFALIAPFLVASLQPTLSAAFSWHLTTTPTQCSDLSISIVGSDGQPPYRVLILPSGPSPLANNVDVRSIIDHPFDGNSTSVSFPINYPANSHFIAAVSDANGFGTGGVSAETVVANSNDASCFNPNKTWSPLFYYGVGTDNQLTQCQPTRVWWNASNAQGATSFYGVVPGGQCFELSGADNPDVQNQETGFAWAPDVRGGTTVIIVASDDRGMGTGGCAEFTVQPASNATCLDNTSPSSTSGVAAGSLQTNAAASGTSSNDGGPNVGVIVGAAVGGIIGLMILIAFIVLSYYCLRQDGRRTRRLQRRAPNMSSTGHMSSPASRQLSMPRQGTSISTNPEERLAQYQPEPFSFTGVGAYNNNGYPYGGQGYPGRMTPGTASAASPRGRLDSVTSGSGAAMSDTSSQAGSRYGWPPPQGANPGLHQASGVGVSDTSSQAGSRYVWPPSQGANPVLQQQTSGLLSVKSGSSLYDASGQMGERHGPNPRLQQQTSGPLSVKSGNSLYDASGQIDERHGANPRLQQQTSGLLSVKSGNSLYDASGQMGERHGANPRLQQQTSGPLSVKSGSGVYDASSQTGSRQRAPSVSSNISGPPRGGPSAMPYEDTVPREPPPAFTPSNMSKNPPTGDVKYKIRNPG